MRNVNSKTIVIGRYRKVEIIALFILQGIPKYEAENNEQHKKGDAYCSFHIMIGLFQQKKDFLLTGSPSNMFPKRKD